MGHLMCQLSQILRNFHLTILEVCIVSDGEDANGDNFFKGSVHQSDMKVKIKGPWRCYQHTTGLVTFGGQDKEKLACLFSNYLEKRKPTLNL